MGEEQQKAFVDKYNNDEEFRNQVNAAFDAILALAQKHGLELTRSDLAEALEDIYEDDPYTFVSERPSFD